MIFLSLVFNLFISVTVMGHVSILYTAFGFTIVVAILIVTVLLVALDINICFKQ
jgi:hypothetical protein